MSDLRFLIVEDEPLIAEDIAVTLQHLDFITSGIAYNKENALKQLSVNTPDFVLLDINLSGKQEGIEIAREINQKYQLPFIFITSYSDKITLQEAKTTGPAGYIVKPFTEQTLYAAIEIALYNHTQKNKIHYPELRVEKINKQLATALSEREFEVLQLIYEGITNQQIAEKIFVSINTIKKHINSAYLKLDVATRTAALAKLRALMLK